LIKDKSINTINSKPNQLPK